MFDNISENDLHFSINVKTYPEEYQIRMDVKEHPSANDDVEHWEEKGKLKLSCPFQVPKSPNFMGKREVTVVFTWQK